MHIVTYNSPPLQFLLVLLVPLLPPFLTDLFASRVQSLQVGTSPGRVGRHYLEPTNLAERDRGREEATVAGKSLRWPQIYIAESSNYVLH